MMKIGCIVGYCQPLDARPENGIWFESEPMTAVASDLVHLAEGSDGVEATAFDGI